MSLTLVQLQTFRRLATLGNFTRTAEELFLSQSAVTQQMKHLQDHFGTPLFDFVGRRAVLTEAGAFLAARAADVLERIDFLEREMREFSAARAGALELGATVTIGNYALPPQLAAFRERHPGIDLRLTIANTDATCAAVRARRIALALVEGTIDDDGAFEVISYARDRLMLIVPPSGHRFSGRTTIAAAELSDESFVARESGSGTLELARARFARVGVAMSVALAFPSNDGVIRAVEAGLGLAVLSELAVARDVAAGYVRVVFVEGIDFGRTFRAIRLRGRTLSPLAERFLAFVTERDSEGVQRLPALDNPEKVR